MLLYGSIVVKKVLYDSVASYTYLNQSLESHSGPMGFTGVLQ